MSKQQRTIDNAPIGARAAFGMGHGPSNAVEQTTTLRSVQVHGSLASFIRPPIGGFGKLPALERPSRLSRGASKGSIGVKQEWDGVVRSSKWEVKKDDLEMVPEDFPLERTHRYIEGADASVIASRISDALRVNSIEAEFDSKPPKAKCKTQDFVSFRIRLYAGSESRDPVVVELQKRKGSASCFMHACRVILAAAEGTEYQGKLPSRPPKVSIGQMKCLQAVYDSGNYEAEAHAALQNAKAMLRSEQRDSNVLGLENLVSLTDPVKSNPSVSAIVSKAIVLGLGDEDIRDEILAMTERDLFSTVSADDYALINHSELLRQLSLTILANSMTLCELNGFLAGAAMGQSWFRECLLPNLLDEIKRADTNACNATQAAICLYSFANSSDSAKQFLVDQGILDILQKANGYGTERNQLLANETGRCLKIMTSPVRVCE